MFSLKRLRNPELDVRLRRRVRASLRRARLAADPAALHPVVETTGVEAGHDDHSAHNVSLLSTGLVWQPSSSEDL